MVEYKSWHLKPAAAADPDRITQMRADITENLTALKQEIEELERMGVNTGGYVQCLEHLQAVYSQVIDLSSFMFGPRSRAAKYYKKSLWDLKHRIKEANADANKTTV